MEDIINEIKRKKEFRKINEVLIRNLVIRNKEYKKFLKSKKDVYKKRTIKSVRALLRKIITPMSKIFYKKFNYFLKNINKKEAIDMLLKLDQSTNERSGEVYLWLIKIINEIKPKKIYDLGCGINLIALYNYGAKLSYYYGFDVDDYIVELLSKFMKIKKIKGSIVNMDLSMVNFNEINKDSNNLVLALKVVDALEEIKIGITQDILGIKGIKIISFPLRSLSGRKMRQRKWFENTLFENKINFKKIIIENELFYVIS